MIAPDPPASQKPGRYGPLRSVGLLAVYARAVTDRSRVFDQISLDLKAALDRAYTRLGMDDQALKAIYIGHGATATHDDCDTAWILMTLGTSLPLDFPCATVPVATYRIELVRDWPGVDDQGAPNLLREEEAARGLRRDAAALWDLAQQCQERILLTVPEANCDMVRFADMRPLGPTGQMAGWSFSLVVNVWGVPTGF